MNEYSVTTKFIDLEMQQKRIRPYLDKAITKVLNHGQYIMGPEVSMFEDQLKQFSGASHAIACANGTDALTLALMSIDVKHEDVVIVPSFTYVATAEAVAQLGAKPFFIDVCETTYNLDIASLKRAIKDSKKMGINIAAIIVVDLFGLPADIDSIMNIAKENNIKVIVDAAQSFGAESKGRKVGTMGEITTTSFFPAKPLGCYGDGGAVFTEDDELAQKIRSLSLHGKGSHKYENVRVGVNSRLDTIQAAVLIEKLKIFPSELLSRQKVAELYNEKLNSSQIKTPQIPDNHSSSWAQYTIKIDDRDFIQKELAKRNIPSIVYYPIPLSKQSGYTNSITVSKGVEISEKLSEKVLSLPMHPYLSEKIIFHICDNIKDIISRR